MVAAIRNLMAGMFLALGLSSAAFWGSRRRFFHPPLVGSGLIRSPPRGARGRGPCGGLIVLAVGASRWSA
jgi:hypothetical protein